MVFTNNKNNTTLNKKSKLPSNLVALKTDNQEKGRKWDRVKNDNEALRETYEKTESFKRYQERLQDCSNSIHFQKLGEKWRLAGASYCCVRLCPICQWRRSLMWQRRFLEALPKIEEAAPKARWIFLTLTIRNCEADEIKDTIKTMNEAFKRLTKLKDWPALGWVKSLEITRNATDNTAHPHLHCLLLVPSSYFQGKCYIKQARWQELWQKSLRVDYLPVCNVQAIKSKKGSDLSAIASAVLEVFKYSVKASDLTADPEFLTALTLQTHRARAIGLGGIVKELVSEDEAKPAPDVELTEEEKEQASVISYAFYPKWRQYARKASPGL